MIGRKQPVGLALLIFAATAFLYTLHGMLPGHLLVPADLPRDDGAWKRDPSIRVRVSNSLLSDVSRQLMPWDLATRRHLRRGELPWRNELAGEGEPLFANPLAGVLSPFTWPRLLAPLRGWASTVWLKLVIAALSMYWLARVLTIEVSAAIVSALVFALSGYATVWALYPQTNVFVLLPAFAAAGIMLVRRPSARNVFLTAGIAALMTGGGHPETLCVGVIAVFLFVVLARERPLSLLGASLAGFLLIGVHTVPFLFLLQRSHVAIARTADLPLRFRKLSILSHLLPGYLGSPIRGELDLTGLFSFAENFHQRNGAYIGALFLLSIGLTYRSLAPSIRRGLLIGTAALLLSWGLPAIGHALRWIPLLKWVAIEYFAVAFVLFTSLAAGPAIFAAGRKRAVALVLLLAGALLLIAGVAPTVAPGMLTRIASAGISHLQQTGLLHQSASTYETRLTYYLASAKWTALRRLAMPAVSWIIFAIGLFGGRRRIMIGAALTELIAFGYGYTPAIRVDEVPSEPPAITAIKRLDPQQRWFVASSNEVFPPNLATLYGMRDVHSYNILTSEAAVRRLTAAGYDPFTFGLPVSPTPDQRRALAAMGVRWFITWDGFSELPSAALAPPAVNAPPEGLGLGIACSAAGALLLIFMMIWPGSLPLDRAGRF